MNLFELHKNYLNIKRFQEIAYIFAKYGFSDLLSKIGLEAASALGLKSTFFNKENKNASRANNLRLALEELGPTFIKLGQILSTRTDLLSKEYLKELEKLQEEIKPIKQSRIEEVLLDGLKIDSISDIFLEFDFNPFATGSIAQAHKARLKNNDLVIVKIQKPNIREIIKTDLDILSYLLKIIQEQIETDFSANWAQILNNFIHSILKELDFQREAQMMERFASLNSPLIKIPKVYFNFLAPTILVQEFINGIKINDLDSLNEFGLDRLDLGEKLATTFFEQIFEYGFFHGDPHPGNLRILDNGIIVFYDFGMVGQIDNETLYHITRIFYATSLKDFDLIARSVTKICQGSILNTDKSLATELKDFVLTYQNKSLKDININMFLSSLDHLLLKHNLSLPADLTILLKAILTLEGSVRVLNPNIQILEFLLPRVNNLVKSQFTKEAMLKRGQAFLMLGADYLGELHSDLFLIMKQQKRLQQESLARMRKIDLYAYHIEKLVYRSILGLVVASSLIGSSILIATGREHTSLPFILGVFGWAIAFLFGAVLIYNILTIDQPGKD